TGYRTGEILLFGPAMGVPSYLRIRTTVSGSRPLIRRRESRGTILIYVAHPWHGWRRRFRMGPLTRFLMRTFHLEPGDLSTLTSLYFATFVMRAAAFAGVAVMQHVMYPAPKDSSWNGPLFPVYALAVIPTV